MTFHFRFMVSELRLRLPISDFQFMVRSSTRHPKLEPSETRLCFGRVSHLGRRGHGQRQGLGKGQAGRYDDAAVVAVRREPLTRREGLRNMGNTCYVNACLQVGVGPSGGGEGSGGAGSGGGEWW